MAKPTKKEVILGSGTLYHQEFTGEVPEHKLIETEENILAAIKGGASVTYTPSITVEEDDSGEITVTIMQSEDVEFKSGLMTLIGDTFKVLAPTARVSTEKGAEIVKIGGANNADGKTHLFHFVNNNPLRPVRVTIVGTNTSGFELAFKKENSTIVDMTIKAEAQDSEGTKIKLMLGEPTE